MRSALYYPFATPRSQGFLRSALLLWDEVHTIVPWKSFAHPYSGNRARAWELVGRNLVPRVREQEMAHRLIEEFSSRELPKEFFWLDENPSPYEFYPQKLKADTWTLLQERALASRLRRNHDYQFTNLAGFAIASKLAEACAGDALARVTDQTLAYGLVADKLASRANVEADVARVVPLTLSLVDASSIPIDALIHFREREAKERAGSQLRRLRHKYAETVQAHVNRLQGLVGEAQLEVANREFEQDMTDDLADLRTELGISKWKLASSSAVVTAVVDGASWFAINPLAGLAKAGGGALKALGSLFRSGVEFTEKQRQVMQNHPMAYMHALSDQRP